jgi:hypothetical protein
MFPDFYLARQKFPRPRLDNVQATVREELGKLQLQRKLPKGAKVAVTAGSRGINNIVSITRTTVEYLKAQGFQPVLVAAMGSHGGGTAEGQREILTSLGFTPESMQVPILTGAETVEVGRTASGLVAYINKHVADLDGIVVINRVKLHTALLGDMHSGLTKACVVGLGGPSGAEQFHSLGIKELPACLRDIGSILIAKKPIVGGLAIVENGYEETAHIVGMEGSRFIEEDVRLLRVASELMPSLPAEKLDVLVIEEMGKNYSGTGMDTNVIGRFRIQGESEPEKPVIRRIVVLDLSEASHGNANGMGLADVVTDKLVARIDLHNTYMNIMTTGFAQRGFLPLHFPTEQEAIQMAVKSLGMTDPRKLRMMIIPCTLHLENLYVSEALLPELKGRSNLEIAKQATALQFDRDKNMTQRLLKRAASHATS